MTGFHAPVLAEEVKLCFAPVASGVLVDGTLGGGGHAAALLALSPETRLLAFDKDPDAVKAAGERLSPFGARAILVEGGYEGLGDILKQMQLTEIQGVLLDLGISSFQVDQAGRGFSYSKEGPLDMRFSKSGGLTSEAVVNSYPQERLKEIIRDYGEEKRAGAVASAIVSARLRSPLRTTAELARVVAAVCRGSVKSLARVFQAIRIEVNGELDALRRALDSFPAFFSKGGRWAVISYHSLEDRLVKRAFSALCEHIDRGRFRLPGEAAALPQWKKVTRKAVRPGPEEVSVNPRSRSAKLRIIERL